MLLTRQPASGIWGDTNTRESMEAGSNKSHNMRGAVLLFAMSRENGEGI